MHCYHFNWRNFQLKEAALHNYSLVYGTKRNKYGMSRNLMSLVAQRQLCFQDKTKQIWHIQKLDVSCCKMTALFLGQNLINMACPETWCFLLHNYGFCLQDKTKQIWHVQKLEVVKPPIMSNVSNTLRMNVIQGVFPFPQSNASWNMSSPRACSCSAENSNSDSLLRRR